MRVSNLSRSLWALLILLCTTNTEAQVNMRLNFSFFTPPGRPVENPTTAQMEGLACKTQDFFSAAVQNYTGVPDAKITAKDIGYEYINDTFWWEFTAEVTPAGTDINEALQPDMNPALNQTLFVTDYIAAAEPLGGGDAYWRDVNAMSYKGNPELPREITGTIPEATCEILPENNTTDADSNTTDPNVTTDGNATAPDDVDGNTTAPNDVDGNTTAPNDVDGNTTAPSDGGDSSINGTNITAPTMAPTVVGSAPNTDNMIFFVLDFGFPALADVKNPTSEEVIDLICQTNAYFAERLSNQTEENVLVEAMHVGWAYDDNATQPIAVRFTANATNEEDGSIIDSQVVFDDMQVSVEEIVQYIEGWVYGVETGNVFYLTESVNFTTYANDPVPVGMIDSYECPTTPAPTNMPTKSAAPSISAAPSNMPSISNMPSSSAAPSSAPSATPPTRTPSGTGPPSSGGDPTVSPAPTASAAPTVDLGPRMGVNITNVFVVSNTDDIARPDDVRAAGLDASWPVFIADIVQNISMDRPENNMRSRALRVGGMGGRRLFVVGVEANSSTVDEVERMSCGEEGTFDPSAACHNVTASYTLLVRGEDVDEVNSEFEAATDTAINDGSYQIIMDQVTAGNKLTIGIPPLPPAPTTPPTQDKSDDDDGMPVWVIILIVLLALLCCLCVLAALFYFMNKDKDDDKELEPYDEEGFAYDFLIPSNQKPQTEVDDEDDTRDVEESGAENFEDEDDGGLAKNVSDDDPVIVMPEEVMEDGSDEEEVALEEKNVAAAEEPESEFLTIEAAADNDGHVAPERDEDNDEDWGEDGDEQGPSDDGNPPEEWEDEEKNGDEEFEEGDDDDEEDDDWADEDGDAK